MKYNEIKRLQQLSGIITEIKVNNPQETSIEDLIIGKTYKFIFDNGSGKEETIGKVIEIYKDPIEGDTRIEIHSPDYKFEYIELYSDEIIKIARI